MMPTDLMEADAKITRSDRAVFRELADGTGVLLHLDSTAYHGINRIGALIWSLIHDGITLGRLTEEVRTRVTDPPPQLADDVEEFVRDLDSRDLVVVEDPPGRAG